jgi:antibiotic biosynthesis monooxygenase (ABM) superfamily enzyme
MVAATEAVTALPPQDDAQAGAGSVAEQEVNKVQATFVDYVEPNRVKILPPAKYKLWACIFVLVYLATWAGDEAGFQKFLRFDGWLSPLTALFVNLLLIVFVLVYATLDLMVACLTFKWNGKPVGLGPWLKAGRSQWATRHSPRNFAVQSIGGVIVVLEEGFGMFNAPASSPTPPPRRKKAMKRTVSAVSTASTAHTEESDVRSESGEKDLTFECDAEHCEAVLKIEHRVNPLKKKEYLKWGEKVAHAANHAPGLVHVQRSDFICLDSKTSLPDGSDREEEEELGSMQRSSVSTAGFLETIYVTFENVDYLNDWMLSPKRKALMKQLRPLLVQPDRVKVQADRVLPDAFTDLVTRQGEGSPSLQPMKWKVCVLTTIALYITLRWTGSFMPYYYEFWGLNDVHPRLRALVSTTVATFINAYVLTPLLLFLFSPWLRRSSHKADTIEPWRTFNDGVQDLRVKGVLTFMLYGGCVITAIVKARTT